MTISFSGLASGLDTSSWVESLVALKQAKIDTLEEEKETVLLSKETLDNIKSFFTSFRSMIEKVTDAQFDTLARLVRINGDDERDLMQVFKYERKMGEGYQYRR